MRAHDFLVEDIDDLRTQDRATNYDDRLSGKGVEPPMSGEHPARIVGTKQITVKQNIVSRGLKKIAGAAILGPLASSLAGVTLVATGAAPAAIFAGIFGGLGFGTYYAFKKLGKEYKTKYQDIIQPSKKFYIKGKSVDEYLEESGLENKLRSLHETYFTQEAISSAGIDLVEVKYGLAAKMQSTETKKIPEPPKYKCPKCGSNEEPEFEVRGFFADDITYECKNCGFTEDMHGDESAETEKFINPEYEKWSTGQNSVQELKYQDEIEVIKSAASDDFKMLRKHLHTASKELERISNEYSIKQPTLIALYARIIGDSPLNFIQKYIKQA